MEITTVGLDLAKNVFQVAARAIIGRESWSASVTRCG